MVGAARSLLLMVVIGACAAIVAVAICLGVWFWAIAPIFGPHRTSDGSMCSSWSGDCTSVSPSLLLKYTGVRPPRDAKMISSHRESGFKDGFVYELLCTAHPARIVTKAESVGYRSMPTSEVFLDDQTVPIGTYVQASSRALPDPSERNQLVVGSSCGTGRRRVLLSWYWDG
jgi:hypothetical protein